MIKICKCEHGVWIRGLWCVYPWPLALRVVRVVLIVRVVWVAYIFAKETF